MSVAALPDKMLGACSRLKPLSLSLVGWCASCNNNNDDDDDDDDDTDNDTDNNNDNYTWQDAGSP